MTLFRKKNFQLNMRGFKVIIQLKVLHPQAERSTSERRPAADEGRADETREVKERGRKEVQKPDAELRKRSDFRWGEAPSEENT